MNWRGFRVRHPRCFGAAVVIKKVRTKAARLLVAFLILNSFYEWNVPFHLHQPNRYIVIGVSLIVMGTVLRISALATLVKKQTLATNGVYSLCRHPLYLGSILLGYGFCCLLDNPKSFVIATAYFVVFYPLTIFWEELQAADRYGDEHAKYAASTPLILPLGRFRQGPFSLGSALRKGGFTLLLVNALLLAAIEVMAETMQ